MVKSGKWIPESKLKSIRNEELGIDMTYLNKSINSLVRFLTFAFGRFETSSISDSRIRNQEL